MPGLSDFALADFDELLKRQPAQQAPSSLAPQPQPPLPSDEVPQVVTQWQSDVSLMYSCTHVQVHCPFHFMCFHPCMYKCTCKLYM